MIIVAGIARSGLTLTMQMLHAGGIPCLGEWPAFEQYGIGQIPWGQCQDKAVKLVDAQIQFPPEGDFSIIRLHRNERQQARSQKKLMRAILGYDAGVSVNQLVKSFGPSYSLIDNWAMGYRTLHLSFEKVIENPVVEATRLAGWIGGVWTKERIQAMADVVRPRTSDCYQGFLELDMINEKIDIPN